MRKTRNVTIALSNEDYRKARRWAAGMDLSLSAAVAGLIQYSAIFEAVVRKYRQEHPDWDPDGA